MLPPQHRSIGCCDVRNDVATPYAQPTTHQLSAQPPHNPLWL